MAGVSVIRANHRLRLVLGGEGRHNALRARDWRAIGRVARAVAAARDLPCVVVVTGRGHDFSTGVDLHALAAGSRAVADETLFAMEEAVVSLAAIPVPIIARIDGAAWGGGLLLALAADVAIASARATFALPVARHGIVLGERMWALLWRATGLAAARDLVWSGRRIGAAEAEMRGIVARAIATDALDRTVDEVAAEITALSPAVREAWKHASHPRWSAESRTRFVDGESFDRLRCRYRERF